MTGTLRENNRLRRWEAALLVGVAVAMLWGVWLDREQAALADKVIRLHVLANSDSEADQALKLRVRDRILAEAADLFAPGETVAQARETLTLALPALAEAGAEVVREEGYEYAVSASLEENVWFPTKQYTDFALPPGELYRPAGGHRRGRGRELVVRGLSTAVPGLRHRDHRGGRRPGGPERERRGPDDRRGRGLCGQIQGHRAVGGLQGLGGGPLDGVFRSGFQTQWRQRKRFGACPRSAGRVQWPYARGT